MTYENAFGVQLEAGAIPPRARVTRLGRWRWRVVILHGLAEYGPGMSGVVLGWHRSSRARATRKAQRELERYLARNRRDESFEVGP